MKSAKLEVYDPPMCCSSGACDTNVNPELARFSSDLEWLKQQLVKVERYNLSSHPAAFTRQKAVKEAMEKEGTVCLPLILVNGAIVCRGIYPSRSELIEFVGIGSGRKEEQTEDSQAPISPIEAAVCGPGCSCGVAPASKKTKVVVSLIVLLAIGTIFIYKALSPKQNVSCNITGTGESRFAALQGVPKFGAVAQLLDITGQKKGEENPVHEDKSVAEIATPPGSSKDGRTIGNQLETFIILNIVASNKDAVFVYVPSKKGEPAGIKTKEAVLAAQRTLNSKGINLGLYTLKVSSPDYATLSKQAQIPAIIVASKGRGMGVVSGEVTESKLIQAFVGLSKTAGCCPPGGGASSDCK